MQRDHKQQRSTAALESQSIQAMEACSSARNVGVPRNLPAHRHREETNSSRLLGTSSCCPFLVRLQGRVARLSMFLSILAFFHIADNATFVPFEDPHYDPIDKIRPFVDHLNTVFKQLYEPDREVCIDEAMVPFKGRSKFKVYMKNKPTKWGFKLYELCESKSGYVYSLEVYCADKRLSNKPVDVTKHLMQPLLDKEHRLYIDNCYCCPELWGRLKGHATMMVGTCRRNRVGMPADLFEGRQRAGDLDYRRKGQLLATRWFHKREVVNFS